jgi:methyltransferase-like protein
LSTVIAGDATPFGRLMKIELDAILRQPDGYLVHEFCESDNEPLYFHEFADRAAAAGLGYLGDAEPSTMFASNYGQAAVQHLQPMTDDPIAVEQHLDLLCNRGFRRTLLCHQEIAPSRHLLPDRLDGLYFSGQLMPRGTATDLKSWSLAEFGVSDGSKVSHKAPLVKALLHYFGTQWPRSLSIDELTEAVAKLIAIDGKRPDPPAVIRDAVILNVVQCVASGIVEPTNAPDSFTTTLSRCPRVSRLACLQAQKSSSVTNGRHEAVQLDEESRKWFGYLDGQRDQNALLAALIRAGERGDLATPRGGVDATTLSDILQKWLTMLAAQALLVS